MKLITTLDQYVCVINTDILMAMKRIEELGNKGEKIIRANMFLLTCDKGKMDMPELLSLGKEAGFRIGLFLLYEKWTDLGSLEKSDEEGHK